MHSSTKKLSEMNSWGDFFTYANILTEKEKGDVFESLTKLILTTRPEYCSILKEVWIQQEGIPKNIREKLNLPSTDEGIDLIAETIRGDFWAIQCKFKGQNQAPTYKEISTFTNLAYSHCQNVSLALLIHTGEKGLKKRALLPERYSELGLEFWLGLTAEDWVRIRKHLKGKSVRPQPKAPRPHQQKAIESAAEHYLLNNASRGRLIMPCGTGKSLTSFWIAKALNAASVIVAVPSLSLIKQSLEDWTREFVAHNEDPRPQWLVICSDESTTKLDKDEFVSDTYSLGIPTTTNIDEISSFLTNNSPGRKVIFTTYQSSDKLAQAARNCGFSFNLAILDEAHKTVGVKSKTFATLLQDKNISITKRMFMTATERVLRGSSDEVFSMNDPDIYGDLFYQLSFKEAIHATPPIISDYKVLTIIVTNEEIEQLIANNRLITDEGKKVEEQQAQTLAAAIALRKATQTYGIKHAISFHRSIRVASDFTDLNNKLNLSGLDNVLLVSSHISSKKSAGERARLMSDFTNDPLALMTNARCLTEGVDVPAIDCVLFADPKQSTIDIVQAAGRALRPYTGKEFGYIMLPLIVPDNVELEEFTDSTPFREVARIIAALSTQDEGIAEEFRITGTAKQNRGGKILFDGTVPVGMKFDLCDFADHINAKIWEKVARINWRPFEEARAYVHELKLRNSVEWQEFCLSSRKPYDIPSIPSRTYSDQGWKSYGDWLGTGTIANNLKDYRPFNEARVFVHSLKLKNQMEWMNYCNSGKKPINIPGSPNNTYSDQGWKSYGDWLGTGTIADRLKKYRSFSEAREFVHDLKLKNGNQWKEYCHSGNLPDDIPSYPNQTYLKKGWISIGDWLGTNSIAPRYRKYRSFNEARAFIHSLNLKNQAEWIKYAKSKERPKDIPATPQGTYSGSGWLGWGDWLGTGTIATQNRRYRPYNEAKEFVHTLKIKSGNEWKAYSKSKKIPFDIPLAPEPTYSGKGWVSWGDWLGTGTIAPGRKDYRPFIKAREYAHKLKLNSNKEWRSHCKAKKNPTDIPVTPDKTYRGKGWTGWGDWLGNNHISAKYRKYLPYDEARKFVHTLKVKSSDEWKQIIKSTDFPTNVPKFPNQTYIDKGWVSWGDWLGNGRVMQSKNKCRPFNEAKEYVHSLKLKNGREWKAFCRSEKRPFDIPAKPDRIYLGKGWSGITDWLGKVKKSKTA